MRKLLKHLPGLAIASFAASMLLAPLSIPAQTPTPEATPATAGTPAKPAATPSVEDRVASLEASVNTTDGTKALPAVSGPGHNAWMMTSSALVLFMTLPGLALFYGGLVRRKNVLSVLAQCLGITGLVTLLWWAVGYSLVFSRGSPFIGGLRFAFLHGVDVRPNADYSYWLSQYVFAMYQLM